MVADLAVIAIGVRLDDTIRNVAVTAINHLVMMLGVAISFVALYVVRFGGAASKINWVRCMLICLGFSLVAALAPLSFGMDEATKKSYEHSEMIWETVNVVMMVCAHALTFQSLTISNAVSKFTKPNSNLLMARLSYSLSMSNFISWVPFLLIRWILVAFPEVTTNDIVANIFFFCGLLSFTRGTFHGLSIWYTVHPFHQTLKPILGSVQIAQQPQLTFWVPDVPKDVKEYQNLVDHVTLNQDPACSVLSISIPESAFDPVTSGHT